MQIPSFDDIFRQIKTNFRLMGIKLDSTGQDLWFFVPFLALTVVVTEETAFFVSRISSENFLELTQLAPCTAQGILSLAKIFCVYLNKNKVYLLIDNLKNLYNSIKDPQKANYIKDDVILLKSLTKYYFVLNLVLLTMYNFSTVIIMAYEFANGDEIKFRLPYSVLVPIPVDTWFNWFIVYFHLIICGYVCGLYFSTVDALYCFSASQLCIHFSLLSNELETLASNDDSALKEIIKKHQYIIKLSEDLEYIYTFPNLLNVLCGSLVICALGFNVTTGSLVQIPAFLVFLSSVLLQILMTSVFGDNLITYKICTGSLVQIPAFLVFLSSVLLQILMMSVFGDNLITESNKVGSSAYLCKWYEMDVSTRKTIMIIRERASKPQKLTAYKFSTICFGSFTKIIRASWSYFTILKTVYKPNE